jgi:ElaB/YqjD/DUF883 family membrane-anchored ribosome-binding protein
MEPMQTERIPDNVQELPGQEETFQNARERLSETFSTVKQRAGEACEYTDQVVRANPWTSIGVGFGAGILIGVLAALAATQGSRRWAG